MRITPWLRKLLSARDQSRAVGTGRRAARLRSPVPSRPRLEVLEDRCTPAFLAPTAYALGAPDLPGTSESGLVGPATGDFNGDGNADILTLAIDVAGVANTRTEYFFTSVLLNRGDGTFAPAKVTIMSQDPTLGGRGITRYIDPFAVGDFNGDGKDDLVLLRYHVESYSTDGVIDFAYDASQLDVLLSAGDGSFVQAMTLALPDFASSIAVGDFTNDGELDLVVARGAYTAVVVVGSVPVVAGAGSRLTIFEGTGTGQFVEHPLATPVGLPVTSLTISDFDRDGKADVVVGVLERVYYDLSYDWAPGNARLFLGNGDGTFQDSRLTGVTGSVRTADFNGDGKPDLFNQTSSNGWIALGNGDGTFQASKPTTSRNNLVADFNGDGKLDSLGYFSDPSNYNTPTLGFFLGKGDGTFQAPRKINSGIAVLQAAVDLNGDRRADLVGYESDSRDSVAVALNDGIWPPTWPAVRINDVAKKEGNQGMVAFTFTVTLSSASTETITMNYATADGGATAGEDYQAASGTLTFNPGETTKAITVWVYGDKTKELDESFSLDLFGVVNADLEDGHAIGTILNDDSGR